MSTAVIIDYGMGNVASVQKALSFLKIESSISKDPAEIRAAKFLILPGVGSFAQGMQNLQESNLVALLREEVLAHKKPFMGICLGMQLLATDGTEPYPCKGLGLIEGEVLKMVLPDKRIPHLGWNNISVHNPQYLSGLDGKDFYFIHSYHFKVSHPEQVAATVHYGQDFVAAIQHENIFATQFHPEKSQQAGLDLLTNFFSAHA